MTTKLKPSLFIDQYGNRVYAKTVKELRSKVGSGGSRVTKMYRDKKDGSIVHCGYVVGTQWFTMYAPVEIPQ